MLFKVGDSIYKKKAIINQYVHKEFEQFKTFIHCQNLPTPRIPKIYNMETDIFTNGRLICPHHKGEGYTLQIAWQPFLVQPNNAHAILFHEFTHLYDYETCIPEYDWDQKDKLLYCYSECHASYVEMKAACRMKDINETAFLDANTIIDYKQSGYSLGEFMEDNTASVTKYILGWDKAGRPLDRMLDVFLKVMYYQGYLWFLHENSKSLFIKYGVDDPCESMLSPQIKAMRYLCMSKITEQSLLELKHIELQVVNGACSA